MKLHAKVVHGELKWDNPELLNKALEKLNGDVIVDIRKIKSKRSEKQNAYYWGLVIEMMSDNGDDTYTWHNRFKAGFIPLTLGLKGIDISKYTDNEIATFAKVLSTTELSVNEFEKYLAFIRQYASQKHSVYIPLPNEAPLEFRY